MNIVRQIVKSLMTACLPCERWLVYGRHANGVAGSAISLTFDDGPHPEITPLVLDRLQTYGWKGTFFVIGEKAAAHPELIQRIVGEGHELGNHTYTHTEPSQISAKKFLCEVQRTRKLLEDLTGKSVRMMRPPKGELNWPKLRGSWRENQTVAMWNVDPKDYRSNCEAELAQWATRYVPRHGDVILLHDVHPQVLRVLDTLQEHRRLIDVDTITMSRWIKPHSAQVAITSRHATHPTGSEEMPCR